MEAIPYDLAELSTYANLQSTYKELFRISEPGSWQSKVINALPAGAWDLVLGGAAGGAAVAMSMPFDTIKTKIQTRNSRASNPLGQVKEFVKVGRHLVRTTGWKSLFLGVTPRLVQQVPGSALCWWGVQSVDKLLEGV